MVALSVDAFVSCFAYGASRIKIPWNSVVVLNLICSGTLAVSLLLGDVIQNWLPPSFTISLCFLLLLGLGLIKIFDSTIKTLIQKHQSFQRNIHFQLGSLGFILNVYANPEEADRDHSRILSPTEAAFLAIALSFDSLAVGLGAGMTQPPPLLVILLSLVAGTIAIVLGCYLGQRIVKNGDLELGWISGTLLIILAILKLP